MATVDFRLYALCVDLLVGAYLVLPAFLSALYLAPFSIPLLASAYSPPDLYLLMHGQFDRYRSERH